MKGPETPVLQAPPQGVGLKLSKRWLVTLQESRTNGMPTPQESSKTRQCKTIIFFFFWLRKRPSLVQGDTLISKWQSQEWNWPSDPNPCLLHHPLSAVPSAESGALPLTSLLLGSDSRYCPWVPRCKFHAPGCRQFTIKVPKTQNAFVQGTSLAEETPRCRGLSSSVLRGWGPVRLEPSTHLLLSPAHLSIQLPSPRAFPTPWLG